MIKTLRLQDFKAFKDSGDVHVKPLTVLAGPNSGGKSSVLQSLLLLKQTLEAPTDVQLSLDGAYLQFSSFSELSFGKPSPPQSKVEFNFGLETGLPSDMVSDLLPEILLPETPADEEDEVKFTNDIRLSFRHNSQEGKSGVAINRFHVTSSLVGTDTLWELVGTLRDGKYRVVTSGDELTVPEHYKDHKTDDARFRHFIPQFLVSNENESERGHQLFIPLHPIFSFPLIELWKELDDNLEYLGPLRERPQRAYLHSGNPMTKIGERGEYAAQILWLERNSKVDYLPELGAQPRNVTLIEAVNDSFARLGLLQNVNVKSQESIMYQILFRLGGPRARKVVTIADVGFGISQLLPILVLGLRSDSSSLLLLEQPEIHLHPRLQANLADFLLTLSSRGRRLIVETHSEHFINRLRRRIAEDSTDTLQSYVNILFVNPPQNGQGASIEPLTIDRFGVIENWPQDFLPEAADEAEAIFAAGLQKRGRELNATFDHRS